MPTVPHIAVIGGEPAGLRAAEVAASGGARVTLFDAMPSVGRKFLIAGKSGLNLTNDEPLPRFLDRYSGTDLPQQEWRTRFETFDNHDLREWAASLGVGTFVSAGGKVFPDSMKAAPLLRRWVSRLRALGVTFRMRHRWTGIGADRRIEFGTPAGRCSEHADAVVLALGGASWPQTGSDGQWLDNLRECGISITPFTPANVGWESDWPIGLIEAVEGAPLKNIAVQVAGQRSLGELVITRYGLEGAPLYRLAPLIRNLLRPELEIDLKPTLTQPEIESKLVGLHRNFVREARRRLNLSQAAAALLKHLPDRGPWRNPEQIAREIKHCKISLTRPRPIAEAISSAGGIAWRSIDQRLMLEQLPGFFLAGEMIDWEAPTGGYLLQACFTTGTHAGLAALDWARLHP